MDDLLTKIAESFPRHPHLRLAVVALSMVGDEKLLAAGDVKGFEEWCYSHPKMHGNFDNCRHFLQAFCPVRFDHTKKSRDWQAVVEKFPEAAEALIEQLRDANKPPLALDFAPHARLGLPKPGKRARSAAHVAERVISAFAVEKGAKLMPVEGRADTTPCFSFAPAMSVSKTYTIYATGDISTEVAESLADQLEAKERALVLTEDEGKRVHLIPGFGEICIGFPVSTSDYDESEVEKELEFLSHILFSQRK